MSSHHLLLLFLLAPIFSSVEEAHGHGQIHKACMSDDDCSPGHHCHSCEQEFSGRRCVRSTASRPLELVGSSLPFNRYAFLATHNSFSIKGVESRTAFPLLTFFNQEDTITEQLQNGVRALMLDLYEYEDDIWLCHSMKGQCHGFTAFVPLVEVLKEVKVFLSSQVREIVTLILEDHVGTPNAVMKIFKQSGLLEYWFPLSSMPRNGEDWPKVEDMIQRNHRLLVFGSQRWKEEEEGIPYQWNFMVENQFGDQGMEGMCRNRRESEALNDTSKSLVLLNYFRTMPVGFSMPTVKMDPLPRLDLGSSAADLVNLGRSFKHGVEIQLPEVDVDLKRTFEIFGKSSCRDNSSPLLDMLLACHRAAGDRWANFVAVDYYKRSGGGGAFEALDMLNGKHVCGQDDIHSCKKLREVPMEKSANVMGKIVSWWTTFKHGGLGMNEL